ncbi:B3 domain-containing protein [Melia azedarach]|uniref:B3 domain-containing protein n=1 Tax=Melia azedarach TaxID=155640 RepID=A0ACC1XXD4_MELAZ|nr:B3 domain-containing protein [Melia azedarach]
MKKTFYYNFLPSKAEEQAAIARGKPYEVTRTLIEIRDYGNPPPPQFDPKHPWHIRKSITANEVFNGKLLLSHNDVFDHIFRYWTMDLCNYVIRGNQFCVAIADYTDEETPKRFQSENIFVQGNYDTYVLGWADVVRSRLLQPGDEIGLFWDVGSATFGFKLLNRGNPTKS